MSARALFVHDRARVTTTTLPRTATRQHSMATHSIALVASVGYVDFIWFPHRHIHHVVCMSARRLHPCRCATRTHSHEHRPEGYGELSAIGMRQQYAAGYAYRQMYGGIVGWNYSHEAVNVRSTDSDRTLVSAMSQLAGWFPQNATLFPTDFPIAAPVWLPIPVHTVPTTNDSLLRAFDPGNCPTYTTWRMSLESSPAYAAKNAEVAPSIVCTAVNLASTCTVGQFISRCVRACVPYDNGSRHLVVCLAS